jgi:hypothetical protein
MYRISRPTRISDADQSTFFVHEGCDCYQRLIVLSSGATDYQDTR